MDSIVIIIILYYISNHKDIIKYISCLYQICRIQYRDGKSSYNAVRQLKFSENKYSPNRTLLKGENKIFAHMFYILQPIFPPKKSIQEISTKILTSEQETRRDEICTSFSRINEFVSTVSTFIARFGRSSHIVLLIDREFRRNGRRKRRTCVTGAVIKWQGSASE